MQCSVYPWTNCIVRIVDVHYICFEKQCFLSDFMCCTSIPRVQCKLNKPLQTFFVAKCHSLHAMLLAQSIDLLLKNYIFSAFVLIKRSEERRVGKECRSRWVTDP